MTALVYDSRRKDNRRGSDTLDTADEHKAWQGEYADAQFERLY